MKKAITRDRVILPADLPVEREEIDVPASEKIAADGAPLIRIGEEISTKLGYRPAAFFRRKGHARIRIFLQASGRFSD